MQLSARNVVARQPASADSEDGGAGESTETVRLTMATAANDAQLRTLRESQHAAREAIQVEVVVDPEGTPKPAVLYGGFDAATCTMGFSVTTGAVRGLTTAAHCPEPAVVWGLSLPMMKRTVGEAPSSKSRSRNFPAGTSNTWLAIDGGSCGGGDSGGPIFIGSSAAGFLSGCAGSRVVGMSMDGLVGTGLTILKVA